MISDDAPLQALCRPVRRTFATVFCLRAPGATPAVVDASTLTGKVMCGYQGWFNCESDGAERGWVHWTSVVEPCGRAMRRLTCGRMFRELGLTRGSYRIHERSRACRRGLQFFQAGYGAAAL